MDDLTLTSRRKFLKAIPPAAAAVAVATIPAVASAPLVEHPWIRARKLARELSATLAEIETADIAGGSVVAVVQPAGRPLAISFADREFFEGEVMQMYATANPDLDVDARLTALAATFKEVAQRIDPSITGMWMGRDALVRGRRWAMQGLYLERKGSEFVGRKPSETSK